MMVVTPLRRHTVPAGLLFPLRPAWAITAAMDSPAALHSNELVPLLDRVAAGDRAALSDLYRRTSAKLYGICARLLGSNADAEDVLQDVYVTVWRKADRFDAAKASPITWLAVIARNKAIDRLRARRLPTAQLDAAGDIADDSASAFELVDQAREQRRVADCLEQLDDKPRAMIRAAFLDGASYPELATREAVPLGTMKSWIRRGLMSLRKCLER